MPSKRSSGMALYVEAGSPFDESVAVILFIQGDMTPSPERAG